MKKLLVIIFLAISCTLAAETLKQQILDTLLYYAEPYKIDRSLKDYAVSRVIVKDQKVTVKLGELFNSLPYRENLVNTMTEAVKSVLPKKYDDFEVQLKIGDTDIRTLIPNYYLEEEDRDETKYNTVYNKTIPFVRNEDRPYKITKGLQDRNIALWQSHGLYYNQRADRWIWQRARVFTTVEDKFTLSFVIPYLMPMLDRAGANVLLPRERDYQKNEVVVDNDKTEFIKGIYREKGKFTTSELPGFGYERSVYVDMQNPFKEGTYRICKAKKEKSAEVRWVPEIPEDGWYWVSISYATEKNSVTDAKYIVRHSGGETTFRVNQRMGGGTWIYLGQFYFEKGDDADNASVILSNESSCRGVITADAVRFGGGIGNVARRPMSQADADSLITDEKERAKVAQYYEKEQYELSGVAKFWEGARYWLQWSGAPKEVFSYTKGANDYVDDYSCRGLWVNWLNHGSVNAPDSVGLGIPLDLAMAWHSDAGCRIDTTIGTLGIYSTIADSKLDKSRKFPHGQSRYVSRDFTDMVMDQFVGDIRKTMNPDWSRRWMWDKSYNESRKPEVVSMLLESLSHQNFEDMQYGLDPRFKFIAARAVYKGMTKFIASQNGKQYVIQPLPVHGFAIELQGEDSIKLRWKATTDTLEKTAITESFVVYSRREEKGWDNGVQVKSDSLVLPINTRELMSYKVVAVNEGGASMDSEILSAYKDDSEPIMIINGFDRVSGPEGFQALPYAGFPDWLDRGVGDGVELQYVGKQHDFDTRKPWISDDDSGWGQCDSDHEFNVIAGNSHDYPLIHGKAIIGSGFSFVSCSRDAVESGAVDIRKYKIIDLILGEQKETLWENDTSRCEFRTFPLNLQRRLREYSESGGALMVSGAYVVTDNWMSKTSTEEDRQFVRDVLNVAWRADRATQNGEVRCVYSPNADFSGEYKFVQNLNEKIYAVESPDALTPIGNAHTVMRYSQNTSSAAVAYKDEIYRTWVSGFPFETIESEDMRKSLMKQILKFLTR